MRRYGTVRGSNALSGKADWEMTQRRLTAFWAHEVIDRVIIQVTAPLPCPFNFPDYRGLTLEQLWTNPTYQMALLDAGLACTYFAGDAFPTYRPTLGPGILAGLLGAPVEFRPDTVWHHPCLTDLLDDTPPSFDLAHPRWRQFTLLAQAAATRAPGRFILGQADFNPPTDTLSALLGPDALCVAMAEAPEAVEAWLQHLTDVYLEVYREQEALLPLKNGYTCWLTAWSAERSFCLQNDFSCMISPAMFRRFCLPELATLTAFFQRSVYHLDGPGAIQHLDTLLELPYLPAIQWTPGDGQPPMTAWLPLLRHIQDAGKGLFLYCAPQEVEELLRELSPEGLIFNTYTESPEEADALVKAAERLTCRRLPVL